MVKDKGFVAICMATYNGGKYLSDQLDSIFQQTYSNWRIFVRDDGSTDATTQILATYEQKFPGKVHVLKNIPGGGNSKSNFFLVLQWVKENINPDFYMLCDQDDFWYKYKIESTISLVKNSDEPSLVHTDLAVGNKNLDVLNESFVRYSNLKPQFRDLSHLLIQNNLTGCTMLWNKELSKKLDFHDASLISMHDWWIALVASCMGKIYYLDYPTLIYRQHQRNVVGAQKVGSLRYIFNKLSNLKDIKIQFLKTYKQAGYFKLVYGSELNIKDRKTLDEYLKIPKTSKLLKWKICIQNRFLKQSLIQLLGEFVFI